VTYETNPRPDDCEVPPTWEDATTRDGEVTFEPSEVFDGYVVNPREPLPTDDDSVTLFVDTRTETAISGAIVFGTGELPAPATDPLTAYFPREKYRPGFPGSSWDNLGYVHLWGGYALSLREGDVDGARVRFTANATEQWRTWCELLAGYPNGLCVPSGDAEGFGGTSCGDVWTCPERCDIDMVRFDCGKYAMCGGGFVEPYCACEGCGCTASITAGQLSFDLHLEENGELSGSVTLEGESYLLYLTPR
jgi:hypothetical protein